MHLLQFLDSSARRRVGLVLGPTGSIVALAGVQNLRDLALSARRTGQSLGDFVNTLPTAESVAYDDLLADGRVLAPLDHPDPAHTLVSGTGLTHLGSAQARNAMHATLQADENTLTDSMKIFRWGVEGGKPVDGSAPVQPEWFYKGDGDILAAPGHPLTSPGFADDGGEEAELAGLYVIDDDGLPCRVGFALGNEFSDHVMEKKNYLYLAHSKLRPASIGPEVFVGHLPSAFAGRVSVSRSGTERWSASFATGEDNMAYTFANLEYHHFKYSNFCRPGDVHIHFFGAAVLSFGSQLEIADGDVMQVSAPPFHLPLTNPLQQLPVSPPPTVTSL